MIRAKRSGFCLLGKKGVEKIYGLVKFAGNLSKKVTHALTNLEQQCSMNVIDLQQKHTELLQEKKKSSIN